jgi:hypothetical protein
MIRLASLSAMALYMSVISAQSQVLGQTPEPNDRVGWVAFCLGFYGEIQRQAINDNNGLLFNKSQANIAKYTDEGFVMALQSRLNDTTRGWAERGERAAGKQFWDTAPLLDTPGVPTMRTEIMAIRSPFANSCDLMAAQSSAYHAQAEAMKRAMAQPPPPPQPNKKQKPGG